MNGEVGTRIEQINGNLTFVLKITQSKGRKTPDVTLFCLTSLQAIKLTPCANYWARRYTHLIDEALQSHKIDSIEKLAAWCYLDDTKVINWEYINRNYV